MDQALTRSPAADAASPWALYTTAQRRRMLFGLFLIGVLTFVDRNIVSILIEPLKHEFTLSDTQVGLLTGFAFALFYALLGLPLSNYADRSDRKLLISVSLAIWSLLTAASGLAQNFWQVMLCRMGVGAAESGSVPASQSLIADYFPPHDRAKALAVYTMCTTVGYVVGLAGGGWAAQHYGWRMALVACGVLGLPITLTCVVWLSEPRRTLGFIRDRADVEPLFAGVSNLLAKPSYRYLLAGMVLYFSLGQGALVFMPSYLIRVHRLSIAEAGFTYSIVAATASIVGALAGGLAADRLARRDIAWLARVPAIGLLLCFPTFELALATKSIVFTLAMAALGLMGLAGALPSLFSSIHAVCGGRRRALAIALAMAVGNLIGQSLGPMATGSLSDAMAPSGDVGEGLRRALAIMVMLFLPAGWVLLAASRHAARDAED